MIFNYSSFPDLIYTYVRRVIVRTIGKRREKLVRNRLRLGRLSTFLELFGLPEALVDYYVIERLRVQIKNKSHEKAVTNYLLGYCEKSLLVDCGSNLGYYSFLFSKYFDKVIAIEPLPRNVRTMNMLKESYNNVRILPIAVSDEEGCLNFYPGPHRGGGSLIKNLRKPEKVRVTTLDNVLEKFSEISVVKVDVEGQEYEVLKGAIQSMHKIKAWVVEVHGTYHGTDICDNKIVSFLKSFGYYVFPISENHVAAEMRLIE